MSRILDGVRVLDLSTFVTGGFCSAMLANLGADVVKVERPGVGDDIRHAGPPFIDGESPYYWTVNYGKRSIELDLKSTEGLEALYTLASDADVFLQNFRPGTAKRLGVSVDEVRERNSEVIYCDISAFGASGPWSDRPGYDLLIQGLSGIMSVTGEPRRQPVKAGIPLTDLITAMWAAFGIVSALYRRELSEKGEYIDLGMLDATLPWLTKQAGRTFAGESPGRMGARDPVLAPYQTFRTADGYLNVACLNDRLWVDLCDAINRSDLADDERFHSNSARVEYMNELEAELEDLFERRTTEEWMDTLTAAGVPAGPVYQVTDALDNPQTRARGVVRELDRDGTTIPVIEHPLHFEHAESGFERPPPRLGEHTRVVLAEAGYDDDAIDRLIQ